MQTRNSPSVVALRSLAREAGMSQYERLSKPELYRRLHEQCNLERLGRLQKRSMKRRCHETGDEDEEPSLDVSSAEQPAGASGALPGADRSTSSKQARAKLPAKKRKARRPQGPIDPIMLTEIPKNAHTYTFKRPNGSEVVYNLETLIDYCLATGNFTEPETRIEFSDDDLRCMDAEAKACGLERDALMEAKHDPKRYAEGYFRVDAINGLERCAGELVAEMATVIENNDAEEGQMRLIMYLFPLFASYYSQLKDADPDFTSMCMKHFVLYIKGPPNRPTRDQCGLIPIILNFFEQVESGEESDFGFS